MEGKINKSNYEVFVLDHMEARLSAEDTILLKAFLALHPELGIDLDEDLVTLQAEDIHFNGKQELKKKRPFISDERYIAYIEQTANTQEREMIEQAALTDESVKKELELYLKTILKADPSIVFENKALLKREVKVIRFAAPAYLSAAAAMLIVFGLWLLLRNSYDDGFKGQPLSLINTNTQALPNTSDFKAAANTATVSEAVIRQQDNHSFAANNNKSAQHQNLKSNRDSLTDPLLNVAKQQPETKLNAPAETTHPEKTMPAVLADNSTKPATPAFMVSIGSDDEETAPLKQERTGFWAKAGKIFRSLNKLGVKKVNAVEIADRKEEQYVLSLGNFSIQKNKYNQ